SPSEEEKDITEIASFDGFTNEREHYKYVSQTSTNQSLQANQYYYFELRHIEGGGDDHFRVSWKTPFAVDTAFQAVPLQYIFDYTCNLDCPEKGVPCDDNDATTLNDVQDGYCNCYGTPQPRNTPNCIGEKGFVNAMHYDSIWGDRLSHLYFNSNYPLNPNRGDKLDVLAVTDGGVDSFGTVIKGYLSVPVTGEYYFNITGRRRAGMKLSATENPEEAVFIAYYDVWGTGIYSHNTVETQTSQAQYLEKGKYYYFEVNYKAHTGGEYVHVFWKTPFYKDDKWRWLDGSYFYQFDPTCEFACMPEGTPCDDGSATTMRDTFNANCLCVGIPCPNNDCGESAEESARNYQSPEACGTSDELKNEATTSWVSCTDATNPATNAAGKWIQYDLGQSYYIDKVNIWNYNVAALTGRGFKDVTMHVSSDGSNWTSIGNFAWSEATGLVGYGGFEQAIGVAARYVIISASSNFDGNNCFGLSKVNFVVYDCLNVGKPCDDGNATTSNDVYNSDCKCEGTIPSIDNFCRKETRIHPNIPIDPNSYDAKLTITSEAILLADYDVSYIAGESIALMPGFHAQTGSGFLAMIDGCPDIVEGIVDLDSTIIRPYDIGDLYSFPPKDEEIDTTVTDLAGGSRIILGTLPNLVTSLEISPNPTKDWAVFDVNIPKATRVSLKVFAANGQEVATLVNNQLRDKGTYAIKFEAGNLAKGIYLISLKTETAIITKNLAVIE
ncbi:MAG: 3-coathanger stack domain-containing protein, partial [Saprospiraceae bacterium]